MDLRSDRWHNEFRARVSGDVRVDRTYSRKRGESSVWKYMPGWPFLPSSLDTARGTNEDRVEYEAYRRLDQRGGGGDASIKPLEGR